MFITSLELTFSSFRQVDVEDSDDLFDIVDVDPETFGKSIELCPTVISSAVFKGIDARLLLVCLLLGNNKWLLGVVVDVTNIALEDEESTLSRQE